MKKKEKKVYLQAKKRYLKKIFGTQEKPRLAIFRSHRHIYGQIINDKKSETLCAMSSVSKTFAREKKLTATKRISFLVGQALGDLALKKNIKKVVFDCGSKIYHGRIKSLAEGARMAGLTF